VAYREEFFELFGECGVLQMIIHRGYILAMVIHRVVTIKTTACVCEIVVFHLGFGTLVTLGS
jgi:hypothetical protein